MPTFWWPRWKPALLTAEHIREGAVVIDVGTNRVTDEALANRLFAHEPARAEEHSRGINGLLVGDVDPRALVERSSAYTPVPGGVGPLTIAMLMSNTVLLAERRLTGD